MFRLLLLVIYLCIVGTISQTVVRGVVGQEITLPCTYNIRDGTNDMCWGRGICPNSKCSNEILHTNGIRVTSRTSSRYQLRGWVRRGDVSLTIVNLKEEDKGLYCCRIEVPGWFNDLKKTLNLQVDRATTTTSRTTTTTKSHTVPVTTTSVLLPATVTPPTTAFFLTTNTPPLAVSNVGPLTTRVPPMTTSSMTEATEFLISDPPFVNINPSTTSLQITYGYDNYFPTTESVTATSSAETTTTSQTMATTKSHTVPVTTTSVLLPTTVTPPPTAFFLTTPPPPLAVPTVGPLTTNVPPMTTSSMIETTEFLTSDPPFFNINSSTTGLQITYGYDYYFPTKESQIATSAAGTLLTPKNTENIDNLPISVSVTITNTSHTVATLSSKTPLITTGTIPTTSPFPSPTTSSPTVAAALPITNVSSITTSSTSTAAALLTASPPLVNIKSSSTSLQHESIENGSSHPTEAASAAGIAHHRMTPADNYVAVSCAVVVLVLLLVLLVLIMKRKNIREYQLNRTKSVNKLEEPEKMLIGMEGENGLFAL